jgi:hypothetical protein
MNSLSELDIDEKNSKIDVYSEKFTRLRLNMTFSDSIVQKFCSRVPEDRFAYGKNLKPGNLFGSCYTETLHQNSSSTLKASRKADVKILRLDIQALMHSIELYQLNQEILKYFNCFESISPVTQSNLSTFQRIYKTGVIRKFQYGDTIIKQNSPIDQIYFIKAGTVEVSKTVQLENTPSTSNAAHSPKFHKFKRKAAIKQNFRIVLLKEGSIVAFEGKKMTLRNFDYRAASGGVEV